LVETLCNKVVGLIPDEVTGFLFFSIGQILPAALWPGVDSVSKGLSTLLVLVRQKLTAAGAISVVLKCSLGVH
jgi:hypothetical protein